MPEFRLKTGLESVNSNFLTSHDVIAKTDIFKLQQMKEHQKEAYISYDEIRGALGLAEAYQESLVLSIFRENIRLNNGIFSQLRENQTLNITIELDWMAEVVDDLCTDVTYNDEDFAMITFKKKGARFAVKQKRCLPCITGGTCGVDGYDIAKATNNSLKANKAFYRQLDLAFLTGKKKVKAVDGTISLVDYKDLGFSFKDAFQDLPAGVLKAKGNIIGDLMDAETFIMNKSDELQLNSTDPLAELKVRRPEQLSIWVSYSALGDIEKVNASLNNPIELFTQGQRLAGAFNSAYVGRLRRSGVKIIAIPDALLPTGICAGIFDNASFVGELACIEELYMDKGSNVNQPETQYFYKSWTVYFSSTLDLGIGNFSYKIPCRDCQVAFLADNDCNSSTVGHTSANPLFTKAVTS